MPDPEKWYLNLYANYDDGTTKTRAGTRIKLAATPSRAVRNSVSPQVNWTVTYANSPDAHPNYVVAPHFLLPNPTDLADGQFKNVLKLPIVNGRTYTVMAKRTGNNAEVFTKRYVTWQRIYYTVHYMNTACRDAFNAIKDELHAMFEAANIELRLRAMKQCRKNGRDVNEEYTSSQRPPNGAVNTNWATLPLTWDEADAPLARQPNHIRMVVTRDLTNKVNGGIEWKMTQQTAAVAGRTIRISSTGQHHGTVVYENDIMTLDRAQPFSAIRVHAKLDPVPLPNDRVALNNPDAPHKGLTMDLAAPTLAAVRHHVRDFTGAGASFTGSVDCRRCAAGWVDAYIHPTAATVGRAHGERNPVKVGSLEVWIAGNTVVLHDPRMILDANAFVRSIRVRYNQTTVNLANPTAARTNENRVTIDLSGQAAVLAHLGGNATTIDIDLDRRGALARGDVGLVETVDFTVEKVTSTHRPTNNAITVSVKDGTDSRYLLLTSTELALFSPASLTGNFVHYDIPIAVPLAVVSTTSPHRVEVNLAGDQTLGPIAAAMQAGRELTFKATTSGRESVGGYSPTDARWFIALNNHLFAGETEANVRRRLKLTIAHEIGHSLLLARQSSTNLTTDPNTEDANDRWYTDPHGGRGPHCHHNAHLVPAGAAHGREDTTSGQVYTFNPQAGGPLCIMYHNIDYVNMGDQFCDRCLEHLKRGVANFGSGA